MSYLITEVMTRPCIVCGEVSFMELELDRVRRWQGGEHVQDVWPSMPAPEREMLITGTHPACWESLFGSEEE